MLKRVFIDSDEPRPRTSAQVMNEECYITLGKNSQQMKSPVVVNTEEYDGSNVIINMSAEIQYEPGTLT